MYSVGTTMATLLRTSVLRHMRYLSGASWRHALQNRGAQQLFPTAHSPNVLAHPTQSRSNTTQSAAVQVEVSNRDNLESQFNYLDISIKERQKISKKCIERILKLLKTSESTVQSWHALLAIRSCGNYLAACSQHERTQFLLAMWELLRKKDIDLDVSHFNALLRTYLENEYYDFSVSEFLADMENSRVPANKVTYQLLINCSCQKGDIPKAVELLESMREREFPLNTSIFNSLILGYSQIGDMENAVNILEIMKNAGVEMSDETFLALMRAYAKKGDMQSIEGTLETCKSQGISFSSGKFLEIVHDLIVNNEQADAGALLRHLPMHSVCDTEEVKTLLKIVHATGRDDLIIKILDSFSTMSANVAFSFIQGLVESNLSNDKIIAICNYLKRWLRDPYRSAVMKSYARNDGTLTIELLRVWKEIGAEIRPQYFFPAIVNFGRKHNVQGILDTLESMINEFNVDPCVYTITDYAIPYGLSVHRNASQARDTLKSYNIPEIIVDNAIVANFIDNGMLRRAAVYVKNHNNLYSDEILKQRLISRLIIGGDVESFRTIFHKLHAQNTNCPADETRIVDGVIISRVSAEEYLNALWLSKYRCKPSVIHEVWKFIDTLGCEISAETADKFQLYLGEHGFDADKEQRELNPAARLIQRIEEAESKNDTQAKKLKGQLLVQYMVEKNVDKFRRLLAMLKNENYPFARSMHSRIVAFFCDMELLEDAEMYMKDIIGFGIPVLFPDRLFNYAKLLAKNKRLDDAVQFLRDNRHIIFADRNMSVAAQFLSYVGSNYDPEKTLACYRALVENHYVQPTRETTGILIKSYLDNNNLQGAMELFKKIAIEHQVLPYRSDLSQKLIKAKDMDLLQEFTDVVGSVIGEWDAMGYLVFDFLKCDMPKQAKKLLKAPGTLQNSKCIDAIIHALITKEDTATLEKFLDISADVKVKKDAIYDSLLEIYAARNDWQSGLNLWTRMQDEDIIPSQRFLPTLADLLKSNLQNIPFARGTAKTERNDPVAADRTS